MVYGEKDPLEELADRYFLESQTHEDNLSKFLVEKKGLAPKSIQMKLSAIRVFLFENDVELPERFWRRLRKRINVKRALTVDKVPSPTQLRKIVGYLPSPGKAPFLLFASSEGRIGEALSLKLCDLEL